MLGEKIKDGDSDYSAAKLRKELSREDRESEVTISAVQTAIIITYIIIFLASPKAEDNLSGVQPVMVLLCIALPVALCRLMAAIKRRLQGGIIYVCILFDIAFLSALIWTFHIQYDQPPGLLLKAPTFVHFFVFIALRCLQYNINYIIFSAFCAITAWLFLTVAAIHHPQGVITHNFVEYLQSSHVLVGAEIEKLLVIATVAVILVLASIRSTRRFATRLQALEDAHSIIDSERAKRLEAEKVRLNAEAQKVKFLTIASHELRTPMNGIIGALDVMDPSIDGLKDVSDSADNLLQIINKMITLTSADALNYNPRPHSASTIVARIKQLGESLGHGASRPTINDKTTTDETLCFDWNIIEPIVKELLSNAIKFGEGHYLEVFLEKNNDDIIIDVCNAGPIIAPEARETIFHLFTQADDELNRSAQGTGLGLPMATRLAKVAGARLVLLRSDETGIVFRLSIPEQKAAKPMDDPWLSEHKSSDARKQAQHVLVVEDNPVNQKVMSRCLEKIGLSPTMANNGDEGVQKFKAGAFDTVLMDIQMPVMDGCQATQLIRSFEKNEGREPSRIIAVTAHAHGDYFNSIKCFGFDELVVKPIRLETIRSLLAGPLQPDALTKDSTNGQNT